MLTVFGFAELLLTYSVLICRLAFYVSDNNVNNFDIFENEVKQEPELILSPKPLLNGSDRSTDSNGSNQLTQSEDPGELLP